LNKTLICTIFFSFTLLAGCAGQLAVKDIIVKPGEVAPGKNSTIFVILTGAKEKVSKIVVTVREAPDMYFSLNDNGNDGDEKAGDNTWSYEVMVPWEAEPCKYHLDVSVYDKEGNEIIKKGLEEQGTGRSGTVEVIVK